MSAPNYAGDLRRAAVGTLLAVDLEEDIYWSTSIPENPSARARELADEARENLAAGGVFVEVRGNGAWVDDTPWFYSATLHYSYVIELVGIDPDRFPPPFGTTAALAIPIQLLTGNVALAWAAAVRVQKVDWIEVVEAGAESIADAAGFFGRITANLALIALVGAAVWFLPRSRS